MESGVLCLGCVPMGEKGPSGLVAYQQTDRPPYPWLYEMFMGSSNLPGLRIEQAGFPDGYEERAFSCGFVCGDLSADGQK